MKRKRRPNYQKLVHAQRRRYARIRTFFLVFLEYAIVFGALLAISRCSPLSPSQNVNDWEKGRNGPIGGVGAADGSGANAQLLVAQENLSKIIDQKAVGGEVALVEAAANSPTDDNWGLLAKLILNADERNALARGDEITLGLVARMQSQGVSQSIITQNLSALKRNKSYQISVKLHIYVESTNGLKDPRDSYFSYFFAAEDADGLVKIIPSKPRDDEQVRRLAEALQHAWQAEIDIHGNP